MSDPTPPEGVVSASSDADGIVIVRIFVCLRSMGCARGAQPMLQRKKEGAAL